MNAAVISVTENGRRLSLRIMDNLCRDIFITRFAFWKYTDDKARSFQSITSLADEIFHSYDALIFISSCGIAVRAIASHIVSKTTDPAVIAIDEQGKFAVSLLSGHIGGANFLAEEISKVIGSIPVITTATDIGGRFSPDSFAKANNLYIHELNASKQIAAAVVNGEKVGFSSEYECKNIPHEFFDSDCNSIGIHIGKDIEVKPFKITLHLVPKNIVVGIGCKKNTDKNLMSDFVKEKLSRVGVPLYRVGLISTIVLKANEAALLSFSGENHIPIKAYSAEELMNVQGEFSSSSFVLKTTGADNVCERSALAEGGHLILKKSAQNGITIAIAERPFSIDFDKKSDWSGFGNP